MSGTSLLLVAGEASGDLHGARLLSELKNLVPSVEAFGLGGGELRRAGLEAVSEENIAVVGITEVLKILKKAKAVFRQVLEEVDRRRPRAAVLVDFPEFNLRLAKELKARGIPVIYYISPQVWAWRRRRVKQIAQRVDLMLVLFPFEAAFYQGHDVAVCHVGHPLIDEVPELNHTWNGGKPPEEAFRIALLPGSRSSELEKLLPRMLETIRHLKKSLPVQPVLIRAATISPEELQPYLDALEETPEVISEDRFSAIAGCHLALCASGTATLETGLLGTPLIVVYRLAPWTYVLAKLLVKVPFFSLVNLVLEKKVVPELVQGEAEPQRVAERAKALLLAPREIEQMRRELGHLRCKLGDRGASRRAAAAVAPWLTGGEKALP
ncbi:MAG: lipid-A-disaccharide synthase [Deltaproteobacteria bacterium]|nr:lipid-A-disaccharide synthase [Deltaproteobacteria bacterium]